MSYDPNQYLEEHRLMWGRFVRLTAYCTAFVCVTLALMAAFLT